MYGVSVFLYTFRPSGAFKGLWEVHGISIALFVQSFDTQEMVGSGALSQSLYTPLIPPYKRSILLAN